MDASAVAERYFEAWNRRDPGGDRGRRGGGAYTDPNVPDGIGAEATARYAGGLFAGFPDLAFEIELGRPPRRVGRRPVADDRHQRRPPTRGCLRRGARSGCRGPTSSPSRAAGSDRWSATSTPRSCRASSGSRWWPTDQAVVFGTSTYVSTDGREPGAMSLTGARGALAGGFRRSAPEPGGDLRPDGDPGIHRLGGRGGRQPDVHDHRVGRPW